MRWERLEWISNLQPFAGFNFSSCIPLSSPALLSDVYCVSVAGRCDPLSLDPTFPRGIFPAPSRGPVREERTSEWCAAGLAYLQAVRRSVGHGPARLASPCSPGLEREFLLHSILNSLASGDRGARTSVVCTRPQICHSSGRAAWPDPNIYLSSLTVLSDETCKGWMCHNRPRREASLRHGLQPPPAQGPMSEHCLQFTSFYFLPMATWFKVLLTVHFSVLVYCTGHIWTLNVHWCRCKRVGLWNTGWHRVKGTSKYPSLMLQGPDYVNCSLKKALRQKACVIFYSLLYTFWHTAYKNKI